MREDRRQGRGYRSRTPPGPTAFRLAGFLLALVVSSPSSADPAVSASGPDGAELYGACKGCHEVGDGARNRVGPHLNDIHGRTAGSIAGFRYSTALKARGEAGLVWDDESLDHYLAKPRTFIPGNRMSFRGMEDAADRRALIAWLTDPHAAETSPDDAGIAPQGAANEMAVAVLETEGDPAYGEYLASECVTCHQASGHADGIPSIVGLPREHFVRALLEYKNNIRSNEVMKLMTGSMGNEEMAALAAYFAGLVPD